MKLIPKLTKTIIIALTVCVMPVKSHAQQLKGVVQEEKKGGEAQPLEGVSVQWLGTGIGTFTDSAGFFSLKRKSGADRLVVRHVGYRPDTLQIHDTTRFVHLMLQAGQTLHAVRVVSTREGSYISGKLIKAFLRYNCFVIHEAVAYILI